MIPLSNGEKNLLFYSGYPFAPSVAAVIQELVDRHAYRVTVIAPPEACEEEVAMHAPAGYLTNDLVALSRAEMRLVPLRDVGNPWHGFQSEALDASLSDLHPDAIWMYPEPVCGSTRQLLRRLYFRRRPVIACEVHENLFEKPPLTQRMKASVLLGRINILLSTCSLSTDSLNEAYWLPGVKAYTVFQPNLDSLEIADSGFDIGRKPGEFWIGFAGRICAEKGWEDLLEVLRNLPPDVKAAIAGEGPDLPGLRSQLQTPVLEGRVRWFGRLGFRALAAFYKQVDVLVVPSKKAPRWKEQFGRVIAEAMAAGTPVVGYASGSIPEVVGNAGLVVEEGNTAKLTEAVRGLVREPGRRKALARLGRERFESFFSVRAFADRLNQILSGRDQR